MWETITSLPIPVLICYGVEALLILAFLIAIICVAAKKKKKVVADGEVVVPISEVLKPDEVAVPIINGLKPGDLDDETGVQYACELQYACEAEEVGAPLEGAVLPENTRLVSDENAVIIQGSKTHSITDAYAELSEEQKAFYDKLKEYALSKEGAEAVNTSSYENVKIGRRSILKLQIKRSYTVASFLLENDMLKDFRRGKGEKAAIKVKPTEVIIYDEDAYTTAHDMVDLTIKQIEHEKQLIIERRKQRRRTKANSEQASANTDAESEKVSAL